MTFSLQYKGFDYVAFYNGAYEDSDSLPSLVLTGANSIEATLDYGINVTTSQIVADPNFTDSLTALGHTIAEAESLGLSVMVRPLIDFLNPALIVPYSVGEWRQDYQPNNVATFFASYKQMIVAEAHVAQQNGAQMLSIGGELDQLTGAQYLPYWTDIISSVHAIFSGKLAYSASWNTASNVSFWSQLDYQGIDCYVPLSNVQNPTLQDLVNGWTRPATQSTNPGAYAVIGNESPMQYFENLSAQSGKPLLFTELGYANDSGAAANPFASGNSPDPALQAELYQAFFQAWAQSGSLSLIGTYFWEWDPNGSTSNVGPGIDSFSPQNSPAQNEVTAGFTTIAPSNLVNDSITKLYIGYFDRAPDPSGETYWVTQFNNGMSLSAIAESYSVQAESTTLYPFLANPNTASAAAINTFIAAIYQNLFNRAPDAGGQAYYVQQLQNGQNTVGGTIVAIESGAQGNDLAILNNKLTVGDYFDTQIFNNNVQFSASVASATLAAVTLSASSVTTAEAIVDAYVKTAPAASHSATVSQAEVGLVGVSANHDLAIAA